MWKLTPSTPTAAKLNMVSSAHRADANVSLTPWAPSQEAEFISATRNGSRRAWAVLTSPARGAASPADELSASRLGIDGYDVALGSVMQARRG